MKLTTAYRFIISLTALLLVLFSTVADAGSIDIKDIRELQTEIQKSQNTLVQARKSKAKNVRQLDASINRLSSKVSSLSSKVKISKDKITSSSSIRQHVSQLNAGLKSLKKARSASNWRLIETSLARMKASAKKLEKSLFLSRNKKGPQVKTINRKPKVKPDISKNTQATVIKQPPKPFPGTKKDLKVDKSPIQSSKGGKLTRQFSHNPPKRAKPSHKILKKPDLPSPSAALKEHKNRVTKLNARLRKIPVMPSMVPDPSDGPREATSQELSTMASASSSNPDNPFIDDISPSAPQWDSHLTIRGNNLGDEAGDVYAVLKQNRVVVRFDVDRWTNSAVSAVIEGHPDREGRIPQKSQINSLLKKMPDFGIRPAKAVIWVVPAENRDGLKAGREITFQTTPSFHVPRISEVVTGSPNRMLIPAGGREPRPTTDPSRGLPTITPGQTIRLLGQNFLSRPGEVHFEIEDRIITAEVNSWNEEVLEVTLPVSVEGLTGQVMKIYVSNHMGKTQLHGTRIFFTPRLTWELLEDVVSVDSLGYVECIGRAKMFYFVLQNDWEVDDTFMTVCNSWRPSVLLGFTAEREPYECNLIRRPYAGTDFAGTDLKCIARDGAPVECGAAVKIRGPVGTRPYTAGMPATELKIECKSTL